MAEQVSLTMPERKDQRGEKNGMESFLGFPLHHGSRDQPQEK